MAIRNGFVSLKGAQPNPDGKLAILLCDRNVCHVEARNRARRIVGDLPRNLLLIDRAEGIGNLRCDRSDLPIQDGLVG